MTTLGKHVGRLARIASVLSLRKLPEADEAPVLGNGTPYTWISRVLEYPATIFTGLPDLDGRDANSSLVSDYLPCRLLCSNAWFPVDGTVRDECGAFRRWRLASRSRFLVGVGPVWSGEV